MSKAVVEIKYPGEKTHQMALSGEIPKHYPRYRCNISSLSQEYSYDGENGVNLKVRRATALIATLLEKEQEFFRCMQKSTPPQAQRSDLPWMTLAEEWKTIQEQKKNEKKVAGLH